MTKRYEDMNLNELMVALDRLFTLQEDLENRIRVIQNIIFHKSSQMRELRSKGKRYQNG